MPNHKAVAMLAGTAATLAAGFVWLIAPAPAATVLSNAGPTLHTTMHPNPARQVRSPRTPRRVRVVPRSAPSAAQPRVWAAAVATTRPQPAVSIASAGPRTTPPSAPTRTAPVATRASSSPSPVRITPTPSPVRPANLVPAGSPSTAPTCNSNYPELTVADQWLFDTLNAERVAHGKPPLRWDPRLHTSACLHNTAMGNADTMSHQLPGEAGLGDRVSAQGVRWSIAAENIGWDNELGGEGVVAATAVNTLMMNEGPGGDHYDNIMSAANYVGVSVVLDPVHGRVWITEDFAAE